MSFAGCRYVPKTVRLALCLTLWLAPVWGATLELLSLNDLITKSTMIVQGQVTGSSAAYSGSVIYTHYKINVVQQWKGVKQTTIDVRAPGGTANGVRQTYAGAPRLVAGQQYVLFLWTSTTHAVSTMGFTQGVFDLSNGSDGQPMVTQEPTTETVLEPRTGRVVKPDGIRMPLAQLVSSIAAAGSGQ